MEKTVVLNSGGFDSITLINYLYLFENKKNIHSLHFLYGANNEKQQLECVNKVCDKFGIINKVIKLPKIDWTHNDFYKNSGYNYEKQYLEYRNLIFLSYALSYAESIGATEIYLAVLNNGNYHDTNDIFFKGLNSFSEKLSNISIKTPFSKMNKEDLLQYSIVCGMKLNDYFSCDKPNLQGNKCEKCGSCLELKWIEDILKVDTPFKALYQSYFDYKNKDFIEQLKEVPKKGREVRALINNECQLRCKHCFYGFDHMYSSKVPKEVYYNTLKELVIKYNFENIHFSGKEPLFDDTILYYAENIYKDNLPCTFDLVTNGINISKYIKKLKDYGINKIFISIDDVFKTNGVRSIEGVYENAIKSCKDNYVPIEVFIDLHKNNYKNIYKILSHLYLNYGVIKFFIRTIRSIGNAENQELLTGKDLYRVFNQIKQFTGEYKNTFVSYYISSEYIPIINGFEPFKNIVTIMDSLYSDYYYENFYFVIERFCNRYKDITITPDGYVLGCASEVSNKNYWKYSAGNILSNSLEDILKKGNEIRCHNASKFPDKNYSCMVNKYD